MNAFDGLISLCAPLPDKHPCPFGWKEVERGSREALGLAGDCGRDCSLRVALTMEEEFAFPFRWLFSDVSSVSNHSFFVKVLHQARDGNLPYKT